MSRSVYSLVLSDDVIRAVDRAAYAMNTSLAEPEDHQVLINRLSGRRVCLACGATYHVSHLGGETKCAKCGEELIQRKDDEEATVRNRLVVYQEETAPLKEFFQERGMLTSIPSLPSAEETAVVIAEKLGI